VLRRYINGTVTMTMTLRRDGDVVMRRWTVAWEWDGCIVNLDSGMYMNTREMGLDADEGQENGVEQNGVINTGVENDIEKFEHTQSDGGYTGVCWLDAMM
jgi:hypothetical protein